MSQKRATQRRWIVHRTFEPDRLSPATLIQAYSQIVPAHIRVLALPPALLAAAEPASLNDQPSPQITDLTGSQLEPALVIGSITKQEAD